MEKIDFTKMVASGNDFVVMESIRQVRKSPGYRMLAKKMCDRKYGVGSDGLLALEKSDKADTRMRIFNADGSEAQMCGNGARCVALYVSLRLTVSSSQKKINIETKAGIIKSVVSKDNVNIKLTDPKDIKLNIPIKVNGRGLMVNFIDTGVPHAVILAEGLDKFDVVGFGRMVRYHRQFMPAGTNVDFVQVTGNDSIRVRTYERGVEDETLACGTGSVASALIFAIRNTQYAIRKVNVLTQSGETLKVHFDRTGDKFINVWLEGKARIVYRGVYHV